MSSPLLAEIAAQLDSAIARIDAAAAPLVLDRIDRMGDEASGASNFYAVRARRGTIFSDYDRALALRLAAWGGAPRRIVEIGGGIGSFAMLGAVAGFECVCVEFNPHRVGLAEALIPAIEAAEPALAARFRFVRAKYPNPRVTVADALAVATNFVTGANDADRAAIYAAVAAHRWAVIDIDRFLDKATTIEERANTLRAIEAAGMAGAPFLDLGDSARFWRFRGGG